MVSLRLCLDPKDLNKAIERENYPLPTIEEVATRMVGAKVLSILDVEQGFWHIRLDSAKGVLLIRLSVDSGGAECLLVSHRLQKSSNAVCIK